VSLASFVAQLLTGLAGASALFLVAAGLTLIFGVTRIVNFAHGSLYMVGAYLAYTLAATLPRGPLGFWGAVLVAALAVALIGIAIETLILKRIYAAPELLQLAATFGVVLIVRDLALALWGPEDLLGPRAPGLHGAVDILGRAIPTYDTVGGPSVVTIQSMLTAKCTAARSSFALALSAENRSGTGLASRQLQETVGGVTPAGLFSWFALEIARLLNSSESAHLKSVAVFQAPA